MINELLSRPNIQEFLNKYPSNRWKELIADLFEIGVLNLRNSYLPMNQIIDLLTPIITIIKEKPQSHIEVIQIIIKIINTTIFQIITIISIIMITKEESAD